MTGLSNADRDWAETLFSDLPRKTPRCPWLPVPLDLPQGYRHNFQLTKCFLLGFEKGSCSLGWLQTWFHVAQAGPKFIQCTTEDDTGLFIFLPPNSRITGECTRTLFRAAEDGTHSGFITG